jgi:osmotically-inducible protein OsmY
MPITPIQDKTITRQVEGRIAGRGLKSPCRITVATIKGEVTLSGTVQHTQQKSTAVQAATGISGVRRVVDRLTVKATIRT